MSPEMRTLAIGVLIGLLTFVVFWQHCRQRQPVTAPTELNIDREQRIIDSLKSINAALKLNNEMLQARLDSAKNRKVVIYKTLDNEIKQLYSMDYISLVRLNDSILTIAGLR